MKNKNVFLAAWQHYLLFLFLLFFLGACVAGGGGPSLGLQKNLEVGELFRSATILPDHTYYVQGPESDPEAIMGLKNKYQLRSRLWSRVEWTEKEMARVVFWMDKRGMDLCSSDGGNIVAPDGQIIGIWYSQRNSSVIKQPAPGVVEVYPFDFTSSTPCYRQFIGDDR